MLEHIYVVVGSGNSDIGKGWLTASIAGVLPNALPVKIDPLLNRRFPPEIGVEVEGTKVSDDLGTYRELGLPVHPDFNILGGALLLEFLKQPEKKLSRGDTKKLTLPDLSDFLAHKLLSLTNRLEDCRSLVIEVGGIITDRENIHIPDAISALGFKTGVTPGVIILSYLEYAEFGFPIKTQIVRHAIRETRRKYTLPIKACFVRRRYVPEEITDERIKEELKNIAFEIQLPSSRMIYEPNLDSVHDLKKMIEETGVFDVTTITQAGQTWKLKKIVEEIENFNEGEVCLVSACLLGIPCRYKLRDNKALAPQVVGLLEKREVIAICPELLAGLSTPRDQVEIIGEDGCDVDGHDVLNGKAKVMSYGHKKDYTRQFIDGAHKALEIAKRVKATKVILYDGSPSCGCSRIYDGSFEHRLKPGCGVFAALLEENGIECIPVRPAREKG